MNVLIWGWGAPNAAPIVNELRRQSGWNLTWVSQHPQADVSSFDLLHGRYPAPPNKESTEALLELIQTGKFDEFDEYFSRHWKANEFDRFSAQHRFAHYVHFLDQLIRQRKIDRIVFASIPHEGPDFVLWHIAERRHIEKLFYYQLDFHDRSRFGITFADVNGPPNGQMIAPPRRTFESYLPDESPWYMRSASRTWSLLKFRLVLSFKHLAKSFLRLKIGELDRFFREIKYLWTFFRLGSKNLPERFVYFPLHMQPELTTSVLGGKFCDQALTLECLRAILPPDVSIIVKENPKQTSMMRDPEFFRRISQIPGLYWAPVLMSSFELTRKSLFVATITGTVGWEALLRQKPVLIFGKAWYSHAPGVTLYRPGLTFQEILGNKADLKALKELYEKLVSGMYTFITDLYYAQANPGFDLQKNGEQVAESIIQNMALLGQTKPVNGYSIRSPNLGS